MRISARRADSGLSLQVRTTHVGTQEADIETTSIQSILCAAASRLRAHYRQNTPERPEQIP